MILLHLDYANLPPAAPITPQVAQDAIRRLEMAALGHNSEGFAQEIENSLHIDRALARRLIEDESGEPILVVAQALGMPADVLRISRSITMTARSTPHCPHGPPSAGTSSCCDGRMKASVPNPKFAPLCSKRLCELRVQRDTRIIKLLVSL